MKSIPTTIARSNAAVSRAIPARIATSLHSHQRLVHLDNVLLRIAGILFQIADRGGVVRLALREGFDEDRLLVLHLGEVDVEDAVMGLRIERHLSARRVDAD